jgi:hypothetical protein
MLGCIRKIARWVLTSAADNPVSHLGRIVAAIPLPKRPTLSLSSRRSRGEDRAHLSIVK